MCIYFFFGFHFRLFFFFLYETQMPPNGHEYSCIKGSVALTNVALKSHDVKQDLKISEGILATLFGATTGMRPPGSPLNSQSNALRPKDVD